MQSANSVSHIKVKTSLERVIAYISSFEVFNEIRGDGNTIGSAVINSSPSQSYEWALSKLPPSIRKLLNGGQTGRDVLAALKREANAAESRKAKNA